MKLLIADDEIHIRTGLTEGIDWREAGFSEVLGAANGNEAWELFKAHSPDIVITDIRMPGMNGLELSRRIKEYRPSVRIMILSGHSDFEYAKQALRIGVTDYELKPLKLRSLLSIVENARLSLLAEREQSSENRSLLGNQWLSKLRRGVLQGESAQSKELSRFFAQADKSDFRTIAIEVDRPTGFIPARDEPYSAFEFARDRLSSYEEYGEQLLAEDGDHRFLLVVKMSFHESPMVWESRWFERLAELNELIQTRFGRTLTVGVSTTGGARDMLRLTEEAVKAVERKLIAGRGSRTLYEKPAGEGSRPLVVYHEDRELTEAIANADKATAERIVRSSIERLRHLPGLRAEDVRLYVRDALRSLARTIEQLGISFEERFGTHHEAGLFSDRLETLDDYGEWMAARYGDVLEQLGAHNGIRHSVVVRKAIEVIRGEIAGDWTVERLAEITGITPNYFSHLFKKETGIAFREYVNDVRIAEAKRFLKTTNRLAYEITEEVGFNSYKHFCQLFKKSEGCSPTEFRKTLKAGL